MKDVSEATGSQSIERATSLLAMVAQHHRQGASLATLVAESGLKQATVRRLLVALIRAGLVDQDEETRRYYLGVSTYVYGTVAADRFGLLPMAGTSVRRLADKSEDTAFFSVRQGLFSICLNREEGSHPIRSHVLNLGQRHPLGVAAHGIAMLAALPDAEMNAVIEANLEVYSEHYPKLTQSWLRELIAETREKGWAVNPGIFHVGSWAIGVVVRGLGGEVKGALSIGAIESRLGPDRQLELSALLKTEARRLEAHFATLGDHIRPMADNDRALPPAGPGRRGAARRA